MNTREPDLQTLREWMMASLDGEITAEQQSQLSSCLAMDPELQEEFDALRRDKALRMENRFPDPGPEVWDGYWQGVYRRAERGLGWILFSLGAMTLLMAGAWEVGREWLLDTSLPVWLRAAGVALVAGGIILLVSVIRERLYLHKNERYKDIQR